jgi:uncharacterized Zn finger protein (UPF0148 family)
MGWLHKLLKGDSEEGSQPGQDAGSLPPPLDPSDLVPPPLPQLANQDPASAHARTYASKVCPSCETPVKPLPHDTVTCANCGKQIVVLSGEDGRWHLLREADIKEFDKEQERIRTERFAADEHALLEAGFLVGDKQVDVVEESHYQEVLERLAGGRSRSGAMKPVIALLTREPDHPHDRNAVKVTVDGETVGYIEKWDAKSIQPLMLRMQKAQQPAWVRATIVGGWEDDVSDRTFRIRLDGLPTV